MSFLSPEERKDFLDDVRSIVKSEVRNEVKEIQRRIDSLEDASLVNEKRDAERLGQIQSVARDVRQTKPEFKNEKAREYAGLSEIINGVSTSIEQFKASIDGRLDLIEDEIKSVRNSNQIEVTDAKGSVSIVPASPTAAMVAYKTESAVQALVIGQEQNDKDTKSASAKTTATIVVSGLGFATAVAHIIMQVYGK